MMQVLHRFGVFVVSFFFFFKQKTAYEMRISDWSSDVCSSDLRDGLAAPDRLAEVARQRDHPSRDGGRDDLRPLRVALDDRGKLDRSGSADDRPSDLDARRRDLIGTQCDDALVGVAAFSTALFRASSRFVAGRSEEHTSELQSLMRISTDAFSSKK